MFEAVADGDFAPEQRDALASPGEGAIDFGGRHGDFFAEFQKAFFVQFDAVQVEANQEFVGFFFDGALENGLEQEQIE